jgi:desulfoferrodoxin-like iron-binding protein
MRKTHQNAARATSDSPFFFASVTPDEHWCKTPSDLPCHAGIRAFTARISLITDGEDMVNVSKEGQVFKCEICGNVVVVKEAGGGELICCGEPMVLEA